MGLTLQPEPPTVIIQPTGNWRFLDLAAIWQYRELLGVLAWRDVRVRYKQTLIGVAWAVLQPAFSMVLFTFIFGRLIKAPSNGVPYPIFVYSGLMLWQYFSSALLTGGESMIAAQGVISKVYFPRILVPMAATLPGIVDLGIASSLMLGMMVYYHVVLSWALLAAPLFVLMTVMAALGVALWLSALNVDYRDARHLMPMLVQLGIFASPVVYASDAVHKLLAPLGQWQFLYGLNPMASTLTGFRWAVLGTPPPDPLELAASLLMIALVLVGGVFYFQRVERTMVDRI